MGIFGYITKVQKSIRNITLIAKDVSNGKLEGRLTHIRDGGELAEAAWAINNMLDKIEVFMREIRASISKAASGVFYRKLIEEGLPGQFKLNASLVSTALDAMEKTVLQTERIRLNSELGNLGRG